MTYSVIQRVGRSACVAMAATCTVAAGCETLNELTKGMARPSAAVRDVSISALTLEQAALDFDLEVTNPYAVALPLVEVDYGLASGGTSFVSGATALGDSIPAGGSRVVRVPAVVSFSGLLDALGSVKPGAMVPYTADLGITVDAPGVGPLTLPLKRKGEFPVPAVPNVDLEQIEWTNVSLDSATALLKVRVVNENAFPVDLSELRYGLDLANRTVASANVRKAAAFPAGGSNLLEIPISFSPSRMGMAFLDVLRGTGGGYDLSGTMKFDTPFGALDLPFEKRGSTSFVR